MKLPTRSGQRLYIGAVICLGLLAAWSSFFQHEHARFALPEYRQTIALLLLVVLAQLANLRLFGPTSVSLSFPFIFLSLLLVGPSAAILGSAAAALVHGFYPARRAWYKVAFNFGSLSIAAGMAWVVYSVSGGVWPPSNLLGAMPAVMAAALAYFLANTLAVSGAIALTNGQSFLHTWDSNYRWLPVYYAAQATLALTAAVAFQQGSYFGSVLSLLSLTAPWSFVWLYVGYAKRRALEKANLERLTVLSRVALAVNKAHGRHEALREVMQGAWQLAGAEGSAVFLRAQNSRDVRLFCELGRNGSFRGPQELDVNEIDLAALGAGSRLVLKPWQSPPAAGVAHCQEARSGGGVAAYLPVSLEDRQLGVIGLYFKSRPEISQEVLKLLWTLAEYAAVEVDRYQKAQELVDSSWRLFQTEERIRREISAHLHGPVQTKLLVLWHHLGQVQTERTTDAGLQVKLDEFRASLMEVQEHLRTVTSTLYPAMVKVGLQPALQSLGSRFQGVFEVTTVVAEDLARLDIEGQGVSEETRLVAYRVVEEALANVAKHANATRVKVHACLSNGALKLSVHDNGKGFHFDEIVPGLGLRMIQELALAVGGTVNIESAPAEGTELEMSLPLASLTPQPAAGDPGPAQGYALSVAA